MTSRNSDIERLFHAAAELTDPLQRKAFLDAACGDDQGLRTEVDSLLAHDASAGSLLDPPVPEETMNPPAGNSAWFGAQGAALLEQPGTLVSGRYKLLQPIGEGGMGSVWVAEQMQPVRRKVALKLVKPGMDSRQVLARFEGERQALAVMDHPNIAKVLDGGLTETGRPYFVMEYVKGVPITQYCDATRSGVSERLQLFTQVCQAVQHAHQKGIIHRDLKPSNILVAPYDDRPVPKVIDFGLAKAIYEPLTEHTLHTAHEIVLGTPLYMAPEQAHLNNLDVDTRADIYSLGVLLYELLTGTTPLEKQRLKEVAWQEVLRLIQEEEPPRPSSRLSSTETLASLAACRQLEPATLTNMVRGELDWIAMKALEKDRNRRYETANGLAMDVQRYLAGELVQAAPPSAGYRVRKFARKHRAALSMVVLTGVLLAAATGISVWQAVRATNAEEKEHVSRLAEARRAESEKQAREQAQKRLQQIARSNEIVLSIFNDVDIRKIKEGPDPLEAVLARRLVKVAEQLHGEVVGEPLMVASLQNRLGLTLQNLGHVEAAIALFVQARKTYATELGADHPYTLMSMHNLGAAYLDAGRLDQALPLEEETLKLRTVKLGPDNPDTLTSAINLGGAYLAVGKLDLARPLFEETLKRMKVKLGPDHPETLASMNDLAMGYQAAGKLDLALPLFEETLQLTKVKLGPDHPDTLRSMGNLGSAYQAAGKLDRALPLLEETFQLTKARLGPDHPDTFRSMNNLGTAYQAAGCLDLALPLYEETFQLAKAKLGPDHPNTLRSMNNLATGYQAAGKLELALPLYEETLKRRKVKLGADHPDTLTSMNNLATGYQAADKLDQALPLLEETLQLTKAKLGADHPDTLGSMNNLAIGYQAAGKLDLALPLLEETLKLAKVKRGPDHPNTLSTMIDLGLAYQAAGEPDQALPLFQEAAAGMEKRHFQSEHAKLDIANLIACCERMRHFDEAERWRRKWAAVVRQRFGADSTPYADELAMLGHNLLAQQNGPKAEEALRECLAIREKLQPEVWNTFNARALLGGALLAEKNYAEAEPLLLSGYQGMKDRAATIPPPGKAALAEAFERLVELYSATNKADQVKKLQAQRTPAELVAAADWELAAGRTQEAIVHLVLVLTAKAGDTMLFQKLAALQAWFALDREFADTCQREVDLAENTTHPETAGRVAEACCLLPSTDKTRLEAVVALARKAVQLGKENQYLPYFKMALGMAEYRNGHFAEADEALMAALKGGKSYPHVAGTAAFYHAMGLFRQGRRDEARKLAIEAASRMKPLPKDAKDPLTDNASADDLILWLAYKEAKALINFDAASASPVEPGGK